ncbi:MAG: hypothetical protein JW894_05695 [Bacteroidales bacterium]|nr:hypothetical protein [Bacteroidales bacterium]
MTKTSTIQFIINNLASKSNEELHNLKSAFDFQEEFEEVFEELDKLNLDVRQHVVDLILQNTSV